MKHHKYTRIPQFSWFFDYLQKLFEINLLIAIKFWQLGLID